MKRKWYLQTWFICLMFAFSRLIVPAIIGIVLLVKQILQEREIGLKYGPIDELDDKISSLNEMIFQKNNKISDLCNEQDSLYSSIASLNDKINYLNSEIDSLEKETVCRHYLFSDYDALSSEECKNKLSILRLEEQNAIKSNSVLKYDPYANKKRITTLSKQILRCFDSECENILLNLSVKNIDSSRNKLTRSFETLNKLYVADGMSIKNNLLEYKLEELNLVYTYELKKEQEREIQKAIKEQMIEEEKVRKEIEQRKAKLEKDQTQCNNEIHKLMGYMQKTQDDAEKQLYVDKIKELEDKINQLEGEKATVLEREANARAGYVYVISLKLPIAKMGLAP